MKNSTISGWFSIACTGLFVFACGGKQVEPTPAPDLSKLNSECVSDACPDGLTAVHYFGIAGPSGPEFCTCTIPCAGDPAACPETTDCQTIADGPGQVCVARQPEPATKLQWYSTCGAPVCGAPNEQPSGFPACSSGVSEGGSCDEAGVQCDAQLGCGASLICAESDPKQSVGGCPISRARFKQEISYVTETERSELAQQVFELPLATYKYIADPKQRQQLGFIIEDVEPSPSVDSERDQVNLYGYTTMVVAALQEQQREIARLRGELDLLRGKTPTDTALQCSE